jgi:putative ABC transport system substrate-binding protein
MAHLFCLRKAFSQLLILIRLIAIATIASLLLMSRAVVIIAAEPSKITRIGVVHLSHQLEAPVVIGLRQGLKEHGYIEGRDVMLEVRAGQGRYETALEAARELASKRVRLFVSAGTMATKAVREAARDLPIVFTQVGEPVAAGFVQSLTRPGRNMTGFSHLLPETTGKRLEVLRELVPTIRAVLLIFNPSNPTSSASAVVAHQSVEQLGIQLRESHVKNREEALSAIRNIDRKTVDAILVLPESVVVNESDTIIQVAAQKRIPVMFHERTWVERGGLASYGASFVELGRQAARYVHKILKGAKPADLPVEQPTKFELVINLKTAKALGVKIPAHLLMEADKVIE